MNTPLQDIVKWLQNCPVAYSKNDKKIILILTGRIFKYKDV